MRESKKKKPTGLKTEMDQRKTEILEDLKKLKRCRSGKQKCLSVDKMLNRFKQTNHKMTMYMYK